MAKYSKFHEQNNLSRKVLDLNRKKGDHEFSFNGVNFLIKKNVFSPEIFNGHQTFTPKLSEFDFSGKSMLEIGCGSGITGLYLLLKSNLKELTMSDINPNAVENSKINADKLRVSDKVKVFQSDVFDQIPLKKYDIIYWNHPWLPEEEHYEYEDEIDRGLFDPDYKYLKKYISGLNKYLAVGGRVFLGFGDFGEISILKNIAQESNFKIKELAREKGDENGEVEFILYELIKNEH